MGLAGRTGRPTESGLETFGDSVAGALPEAALANATGGVSYAVLVPADATVGFDLPRRYG